jgi:hypothetical protein
VRRPLLGLVAVLLLGSAGCDDARYGSGDGGSDTGDAGPRDAGEDVPIAPDLRPDGEDPGPVDLGMDGGEHDVDDDGFTFGCPPGACPGGSICGADEECVIPIAGCPFVVGPDGGQRIGVLLPLSGDLAWIGRSMYLGAELAALEFDTHVGPLQIVVCSTGTDVDGARRMHRYLMDELGVEAFVGPALSTQVIGIMPDARRSETLLVSPSATAPALRSLDDGGLVWSLAPTEAQAARGAAFRALDHPARGAGDALGRVLVFTDAQNPVLEEMGQEARSVLAGAPGVSIVQLGQQWRQQLPPLDPAEVKVVLVLAGDNSLEVFAELEDAFPNPERVWIFGVGFFDEERLWAESRARDLRLELELVGTDFGALGPVGHFFTRDFRASFGDEEMVFAAHTYDAVWALGYAGLTPRGQERTGPGYAAGLAGVLREGGEQVAVGPDDVWDPPEPMVPWDLQGASSELAMDPVSGTCLSGVARWTLGPIGRDFEGLFDPRLEQW